jgi:hypothetical protein
MGSQQLRYGERTARGIAGSKKAVTLEESRRVRSSKKIMVGRDTKRKIAVFRLSATITKFPNVGFGIIDSISKCRFFSHREPKHAWCRLVTYS